MSLIPHNEICDLAKLTMLVYEYGKNFTIDSDQTIEDFVKESLSSEEGRIKNELRLKVIKELSSSSPHGKVHKFYSVKSTDLQVGITISETHKRICVVFRGSESSYDWYYDLSFLKKQLHDNVYVHGGFYNQLHGDEMYDKLKSDLLELIHQNQGYKIYITGHSLGAALSTLFGYELSKDIDNDICVVSFASPRVGNSEFRTEFDKKSNLIHYRVSNDRDIVTAAPMFYFQHVGINIALSENDFEVYFNYDYNWLKYSLFNCWRVSDHDMDLYYKRISNSSWL